MDCKYIEQNDFHEKYLLDRLGENEKAEYLSHLNSCKTCKNRLDSEKEIIGSVRHFGKSEMKSEIAKQVAEIKSREKNISWDMILKVAAIFFFLVITPGLVYYYQSVEPPKISELYNFDESMNKKGEMEIVKDEKEEINDILVDNRESESNDNISDVLGSAGGKGAGASVQSVGMAKPVKKSAERIEIKEELAAADEKELTMEQPASPATVSSLSELDKFKKPDFISVTGPKTNRAKVLSRKKIDTKSHSYFNETKSEKMSTATGQAIDESKSEDHSSATIENIDITKLDYKIDDQIIIVNLIPLSENSNFYFQLAIPDSFPVLIKKTDKVDLEMDWYVNSAFKKINSEDISLNISDKNHFFINIPDNNIYKIDINSDTTKAVLLR